MVGDVRNLITVGQTIPIGVGVGRVGLELVHLLDVG